MAADQGEVTLLLCRLRAGEAEVLPRLFEIVYPELHRIAGQHMRRERKDHTLQPTALLNEVYLKIVGSSIEWQNRAHFLGVAARVMRHILIDHAKARKAIKRGGSNGPVPLDAVRAGTPERDAELLALEEALTTLEQENPTMARIVELRFFGGLSFDEIAEVLSVSSRTAKRYWATARTRLYKDMAQRGHHEPEGKPSPTRR